jgi:hypothetical protein
VSLTVNPAPQTMTFTSIAADDGWVLESKETSNVGGKVNSINTGAGALRLGDDYGTVTQGERRTSPSSSTLALPEEPPSRRPRETSARPHGHKSVHDPWRCSCRYRHRRI